VLVPVLFGFAALTIDVGVIFNSRADLQNAADAAALAATNVLSQDRTAVSEARANAMDIIRRHYSLGHELDIDPADLVFGRADYDPIANSFSFTPTENFPDAVRVVASKTEGSPNGPVPLFFAAIFGKSSANVQAAATAALTGTRDMAVVIDLSGSMKYDSDLRYFDRTPINLRDVWASLDGPVPARPYIPGAEHETQYAGDTGPTIGVMDAWGDPITLTYDATSDPGLWYIPSGSACTEPDVQASLQDRGYTAGQITTLMSGGSTWTNSAAVMTGLAEWSPSGAGDTSVGSSELTWVAYPPYRKTWTWIDYLDWVADPDSNLADAHPEFRYRLGVKTFTDFLLERVDNFSETDLSLTPEEPLRSVKDGVQAMVDMTRSFDHLSLEIFATTGHHEVDLSSDRQRVADRLYAMQANHYDSSTNIGAGIQLAIAELTSPRARAGAKKVIVLMSDGAHNTGPDPVTQAQIAADQGIVIYAISVGWLADRPTMQAIAAITGGQEFFAGGTPEQYTVQLLDIFRTIGGLGNANLIE
jgi:hypothetical protein